MTEPTATNDTEPAAAPRPPAAARAFDRDRLFSIFFFVIYFYLVYELVRVLSPFLAPLLSAVMMALVVFPLRQQIARKVPGPSLVAFLTTVLTMVTIVVPVTLLAWILMHEAATAVPAVREWLTAQNGPGQALAQGHMPEPIARVWTALARYAAMIDLDLRSATLEAVRGIGNRVTLAGAAFVGEFFVTLFQTMIFMFALFFFLRDGPRITKSLLDFVPMETASKTLVLGSLDRTLVAMVRGTVVTASAQGAMTGIGLALFGAPFPVLLGFAATFLAVVPFVGASIVWAPAALYLFLTGHTGAAVGLTVWGLLVVGLIDNFLRPMVVGQHSKLPVTLLFLGVLGGIQVYGLIGGLIAPLLIASVFAFARIYREQYLGDAQPPPA